MASRCVKLTMPKQLYEEGKRLVREFGYSNLQELTLEGLRKEVIELRKEKALAVLKQLHGSAKFKPDLTREQREDIAERHTPERAREITKRFGLKDFQGI